MNKESHENVVMMYFTFALTFQNHCSRRNNIPFSTCQYTVSSRVVLVCVRDFFWQLNYIASYFLMAEERFPLLIIYGSQTGQAKSIAEDINSKADSLNYAPELLSMDESVERVNNLMIVVQCCIMNFLSSCFAVSLERLQIDCFCDIFVRHSLFIQSGKI